jgi:siroheme synthase
LEHLAATIEAEQLQSPSVIVVGDVVQGAMAWQASDAQTEHTGLTIAA